MTKSAWRFVRQKIRELPPARRRSRRQSIRPSQPDGLYAVLPSDHRKPYDIEEVVARIFDGDDFLEFQPQHAPEMLCANARLSGRPVGADRQSARIV